MFADPAVVPEMTWKTEPTEGHIAGDAVTRSGQPVQQAPIDLVDRVSGQVVQTTRTTGSGWFGSVDVEPGSYLVRLQPGRTTGQPLRHVDVEAGELASTEGRPQGQRDSGQQQKPPAALSRQRTGGGCVPREPRGMRPPRVPSADAR